MSSKGLRSGNPLHTVQGGLAATVVCGLLLVHPAVTSASAPADEPTTQAPSVRALDPCGARLLDEALVKSAIVRSLVEQLAASDVVVYLSSAQPLTRANGVPRGKTQFLSANPAGRFLQIWVDPLQRPTARIAVLAHELQHALEVAGAPGATDIDAFRCLYEGMGTRGHTTGASHGVVRYETEAATDVEARVLQELGQRPGLGTQAAAR